MDKRGHVLNAVFLAVGLAFILEPSGSVETLTTVAELFVPLVLGALFPDVDTHFGKHRKTLHNLFVLGVVVAYPLAFGNLQWVWLGVLTHYVLDVFGSKRGIALFHPLSPREYGMPVGVATSSDYADVMTLAVTAFELTVAAFAVFVLPDLLPEGTLSAVGL